MFIMICKDSEGKEKAGTGKGNQVPLTGIKTLNGAIKRIKLYNLNNNLNYKILKGDFYLGFQTVYEV